MNNKIPKDSVLKKKGFYAALYSCVGIMLIIAAVMSFNNYSQAKKLQQKSEVDLSQMQDASKSQDKSYLTPADRSTSKATTQKSNPAPTATAAATPEARQSNSELNQNAPAEAAKSQEAKAPQEAEKQPAAPAVQTQSEVVPVQPAENHTVIIEPIAPPDMNADMGMDVQSNSSPLTVDESYLTADPVETKPVFNEFAEGKYMKWPLIGEIVMDFSSDRMIYDKTLDQYRTNNSICISSELGTQVRSATDGVVKSITKSVEKGNSITIDNGNGWQTTYSQLQDGILVSEGDVVKEGQVIGGVSSPSIYGVLLGNHLEFEVTKDGTPVDPKNILSKN